MLDEYFSYSAELLAEGRRAFALQLAAQTAPDHMTPAQVVDAATLYEGWLKEVEAKAEPKPRPKLVKGHE